MNNNKKKQIDDIAKYICKNYSPYCSMCPDCYAQEEATKLYNAGYRKQSEGEWQKRIWIIFDSEKVGYRCSECNTTWDTPTNFCPNCGAKMAELGEKLAGENVEIDVRTGEVRAGT